jgi:hypothetical protein
MLTGFRVALTVLMAMVALVSVRLGVVTVALALATIGVVWLDWSRPLHRAYFVAFALAQIGYSIAYLDTRGVGYSVSMALLVLIPLFAGHRLTSRR